MEWIRFESHGRYHAIFGVTMGTTYITFCGRMQRMASTTPTEAPPQRCHCCRSRIEHPYLIPDNLKAAIVPTQATAALKAELDRCDREIDEYRRQASSKTKAWIAAMGELDFTIEKDLIRTGGNH